jgi:hypothetical protein
MCVAASPSSSHDDFIDSLLLLLLLLLLLVLLSSLTLALALALAPATALAPPPKRRGHIKEYFLEGLLDEQSKFPDKEAPSPTLSLHHE